MSKIELALSCFNNRFNCAQAVLSTYGPDFGLDYETALKVSGAFGAGMGRMGETCGAVTGAFMVIGLKHGKFKVEDDPARETTYQLVREFSKRFKERNGSIKCSKLLNCDISTLEGMNLAKEKKLFETLCPKFVKEASEILEEMLK